MRRPGQAPASAYVLPHNVNEVDRLDVQHYVIRAVLGANHLCPVRSPDRVLDVGCGSGQWAYDLCAEFPGAQVLGVDLVPSKADRPPNFRFVTANVLQGLPLAGGRFDLVHQRFVLPGIPVRHFAGVVRELARVTSPGGWIELAEADHGRWLAPVGPATRRLMDVGRRLGVPLGLDTTGIVHAAIPRYLREAGLARVEQHTVELPVGRWGGPLGELMATAYRAIFARLGELFQSRLGIPTMECHELQSMAQDECERIRTSAIFTVFWGQRPP